MVSTVKVNILPDATQAEIDALTNIPAGSIVFNTTTQRTNVTNDGGATPTWTVLGNDTYQEIYDNDPTAETVVENAKPLLVTSGYNSVLGTFNVANPGSGYAFGDQLEPAGGVAIINARLIVAAVDGGGGILGVGLIPTAGNSGVYSTDPSPLLANPVTSITGVGVGAQIDITMEPSGEIVLNPADFSAITMNCDHGYLTLPVITAGVESGITLPTGAIRYLQTDSKFHVGILGSDYTLWSTRDTPNGNNEVWHNDGSGNLVGNSNLTANDGASILAINGTDGFLKLSSMDSVARDSVPSPVVGNMLYNTVSNLIEYRTPTGWATLTQQFGNANFQTLSILDSPGPTFFYNNAGMKINDNPETKSVQIDESRILLNDTPGTREVEIFYNQVQVRDAGFNNFANVFYDRFEIDGPTRQMELVEGGGLQINNKINGNALILNENKIETLSGDLNIEAATQIINVLSQTIFNDLGSLITTIDGTGIKVNDDPETQSALLIDGKLSLNTSVRQTNLDATNWAFYTQSVPFDSAMVIDHNFLDLNTGAGNIKYRMNTTGLNLSADGGANKTLITDTQIKINNVPETESLTMNQQSVGLVGPNRVIAMDSTQGIDLASIPLGTTVNIDENSINVDPGSGNPKTRIDSAGVVVYDAPLTNSVTINNDSIVGLSDFNLSSPDLTVNTLRPVLRQLGKLDQTVVSNTAAETSILGTFTGTDTIAANSLFQGSDFKLTVGGMLTTNGTNQTLHIRVYFGNAIVADTGVITLTSVVTSEHLELELDSVMFRQIGAPTVAETMASGEFAYREDSNPNIKKTFAMLTNNTTTVDTTVANTLDVTVQWGAASASNNFTVDTLSFERIG
jgi:hypothetical protein